MSQSKIHSHQIQIMSLNSIVIATIISAATISAAPTTSFIDCVAKLPSTSPTYAVDVWTQCVQTAIPACADVSFDGAAYNIPVDSTCLLEDHIVVNGHSSDSKARRETTDPLTDSSPNQPHRRGMSFCFGPLLCYQSL